MPRAPRILFAFVLPLIAVSGSQAQQSQPFQMASLRPVPGLVLHRVSPNPERPDGPVLYQLLLNASGTAGTVPVFDTNPRHLVDSPITINGGNVVIGGGSGLTINGSSGLVTFANGQAFPGSVNSVAALDSFINIGGTAANPTIGLKTVNTDARYLTLTGGTMTGHITFAAGQTFPSSGLPNLAGEVTGPVGTTVVSNAVATNTANAIVRRDGLGNFTAGNITLNGNLLLPNTAAAGSAGVLILGGATFLHNFGNGNTFVGGSAGNFTMTGAAYSNTAVGNFALSSNTTGNSNVAIGAFALQANTTGLSNTAVGIQALQHASTANSNSAFGAGALSSNTTGAANAAFGANALFFNTTGQLNSAFGDSALEANNTGGSNAAFGYSALSSNTIGNGNSAFGLQALYANTAGNNNAAFGSSALQNNTSDNNSAFGYSALYSNTTGFQNSAFGANALGSNMTGQDNAAFGYNALYHNTSPGNSAFGSQALVSNTTGFSNTASGDGALESNTTGNNNSAFGVDALVSLVSGTGDIALGQFAGSNLNAGENYDIDIGNSGVAGESNTIRIGTAGNQSATYIAGVNGVTIGSASEVFISSAGQLGTILSSRRYKQDIADLGAESDVLMKLRPVAFYYKPELDSTHTRQYGLVAEEVAQIAPSLVIFDDQGKPQTVRYHFVNAMLLNEVQKQRRLIEAQDEKIERLSRALESQQASEQQQITAMQEQMKTLMLRLAAVEKSRQPSGKREETVALAQ